VEVIEDEASRPDGGHFNVIHRETALPAEVYLAGDDELMGWAIGQRVRSQVGGGEIRVAPIEYVIVRKLEFCELSGSDRHPSDVAMTLRISGDTVNEGVLLQWAERLELLEVLKQARSFSPD
jgi:hypothetical protein